MTAPIGVLIVDDQRDIRLMLRMVIQSKGSEFYVTGEATNGAEAIEHAQREDPRVIVLDKLMPDMNGTEAATIIRKTRPDQIIILCSAYLGEDVVERAQAAGIDHWIGKDELFTLPELIRAVTYS